MKEKTLVSGFYSAVFQLESHVNTSVGHRLSLLIMGRADRPPLRFTLACVDHHTLSEWTGWWKDILGLGGVIKSTWRSLTGIVSCTLTLSWHKQAIFPRFITALSKLTLPNPFFGGHPPAFLTPAHIYGKDLFGCEQYRVLILWWCLVFTFLSVGSVAQTQKWRKKKKKIYSFRSRYEIVSATFKYAAVTWRCKSIASYLEMNVITNL